MAFNIINIPLICLVIVLSHFAISLEGSPPPQIEVSSSIECARERRIFVTTSYACARNGVLWQLGLDGADLDDGMEVWNTMKEKAGLEIKLRQAAVVYFSDCKSCNADCTAGIEAEYENANCCLL